MAAPVRVKITSVRFENDLLEEHADPFWLLVSAEQYRLIYDVGKRILLECNSIPAYRRKLDKFCESDTQSHSSSATWKNKSKDARTPPQFLDVTEDIASNVRNDIPMENDSSKKRKRSRSIDELKLVEDAGSDSESIHLHRKKKKKKNRKSVEKDVSITDDDRITLQTSKNDGFHKLADSESETHSKSKSVHSKKKPKQPADSKKRFSTNDINKTPPYEMNENDNHTGADDTQNISLATSSEIEKQKRELLGTLDDFVESWKLPCSKGDSQVKLALPENEKYEGGIGAPLVPRKRKRRKGKKSKEKDGVKTVIKIEDKPRSSVLNLPSNMQPQNCKITFDSDSDNSLEEKDTKNNENTVEIDKIMVTEESPEMKSKSFDSSYTINRDDKDGLKSLSMSKKYKDLTPTCRKYLMRSTLGVLDSLRSTSSNTYSCQVPNDHAVTTEDVSKSSNHDLISITTEMSSPAYTKPYSSPVTNSKFGPMKSSHSSCDDSFGFSQGKTAPASGNEQQSAQGSGSDCEAKFLELLQRRKLSNTSCNIATSQNGVTICSRNKSPRWNPRGQVNGFADPATDVLTNTSTVTQFNGNGHLSAISQSNGRASGDAQLEKVEVFPLDIEKCPALSGHPYVGDILAYKVLEMNEDYTPVVSDFKTGKVLSFGDGVVAFKLFGNTAPKKLTGKFELVYDDEEQVTEASNIDDEQVSVEFVSMMDTRLVKRYTDSSK